MNNNIFIVIFNQEITSDINENIESIKKLNPDYNVRVINYNSLDITNVCLFNKSFKYKDDYLLHWCYNNYNKNDLYINYIYVLLNEYGGIYIDYNLKNIKCSDYIKDNNFIIRDLNKIYLLKCNKNECNDKLKHFQYSEYICEHKDNTNILKCNISIISDNKFKDKISSLSLDNNSYCVGCTNNIKYPYLCKCFEKYNIKQPIFYDALKHKTNVLHSHQNILEYAKKNNLPYVIIFEDDAYPCINIKQEFEDIKKHIIENNFYYGIISLGWSHAEFHINKYSISEKFDIIKDHVCGAHAYIVLNEFYDEILKPYHDKKYLLKTTNFKIPWPDVVMNNNCCPHCIVSKKLYFIQKDWIRKQYLAFSKKYNKYGFSINEDIKKYFNYFENEILTKEEKEEIFNLNLENYFKDIKSI